MIFHWRKNFTQIPYLCKVGRSSDEWIDFNLFGHQIVAHLDKSMDLENSLNIVDGKKVPVRHFGIIMKWDKWHQFVDHLSNKNVDFLIEPHIRFKGKPGEQATFFIKDPSGNALEFKSFKDKEMIFKNF
ncbi:glyoxalase/bleomycin resistance protein/dioxygenase superfamily protein [bacterium]|nr:MAG: glyoxalase/bleomycin resistance protein/dioxygenase superfamily protein [bacterium]